MFNNSSKQAKNANTTAAVEAFLANGGNIKRRKSSVKERKAAPANYFTSTHGPAPVQTLNTWETALLKLATFAQQNPNCIKVQWGNDGRIANSVEELYGL